MIAAILSRHLTVPAKTKILVHNHALETGQPIMPLVERLAQTETVHPHLHNQNATTSIWHPIAPTNAKMLGANHVPAMEKLTMKAAATPNVLKTSYAMIKEAVLRHGTDIAAMM